MFIFVSVLAFKQNDSTLYIQAASSGDNATRNAVHALGHVKGAWTASADFGKEIKTMQHLFPTQEKTKDVK